MLLILLSYNLYFCYSMPYAIFLLLQPSIHQYIWTCIYFFSSCYLSPTSYVLLLAMSPEFHCWPCVVMCCFSMSWSKWTKGPQHIACCPAPITGLQKQHEPSTGPSAALVWEHESQTALSTSTFGIWVSPPRPVDSISPGRTAVGWNSRELLKCYSWGFKTKLFYWARICWCSHSY